jgi:hypothetical protein
MGSLFLDRSLWTVGGQLLGHENLVALKMNLAL